MRREKRDGPKEEPLKGEDIIKDPPLSVIERRVQRRLVGIRNAELNAIWIRHIQELRDFEDITEDLKLLSEVRKLEAAKKKDGRDGEEMATFEDWTAMPVEAKAEKVNWGAIVNES